MIKQSLMCWKNKFTARLRKFAENEAGAVTVDWIVGAAAGVGMALAVMNSVGTSTHDHAERVDDKFDEIGIMTY